MSFSHAFLWRQTTLILDHNAFQWKLRSFKSTKLCYLSTHTSLILSCLLSNKAVSLHLSCSTLLKARSGWQTQHLDIFIPRCLKLQTSPAYGLSPKGLQAIVEPTAELWRNEDKANFLAWTRSHCIPIHLHFADATFWSLSHVISYFGLRWDSDVRQ